MKRDEIRHVVDVALAENGYSRGWYAWGGAHLVLFDRDKCTASMWAGPAYVVHLPSGTSRKRFIERISVLPCLGDPKPIPAKVVRQKHKQLDLEDYLRA